MYWYAHDLSLSYNTISQDLSDAVFIILESLFFLSTAFVSLGHSLQSLTSGRENSLHSIWRWHCLVHHSTHSFAFPSGCCQMVAIHGGEAPPLHFNHTVLESGGGLLTLIGYKVCVRLLCWMLSSPQLSRAPCVQLSGRIWPSVLGTL